MPEISRFFGITIAMFHQEHGPAHFHAVYGEFRASVTIDTLEVRGYLPGRGLALVLEWGHLHRQELLENWRRARSGMPLVRVAPLE